MKRSVLPKPMLAEAGLVTRRTPTATADLTPMLDTIFLIILLLLATLVNSSIVRGFPVNLPALAENSTIQRNDQAIEISVDREGAVYVAKERTSLSDLDQVLGAMVTTPTQKLLFRADADVAYGQAALVLARLAECLPQHEVVLIVRKSASDSAADTRLPKEVDS